ncbi:hypothetical protein BD626DRAFT_428672 [Schizophyllum amplum]|uniref:Uncharacterized protein n=1 Tax=Schizophyllum amplum TaxID=97359 RepID=A0A550CKW4_9AGAR|nr:hypothetical protein BD626DRAFT_428672 [Auriculariopsis ampla]
MKSCLKLPTPLPSPTPSGRSTPKKCVVFCEDSDVEVYEADDWDRTPMQPSKKLSYQEIIELKELTRGLPQADQPSCFVTGRPSQRRLSAVPITLLPLLPDSNTGPASTYPPVDTSHTPSIPLSPPTSPRRAQYKSFSFLPLLDASKPDAHHPTPPHSPALSALSDLDMDPPTPALTNSSLESSPRSVPPSSPPEVTLFIPLPKSRRRFSGGSFTNDVPSLYLDDDVVPDAPEYAKEHASRTLLFAGSKERVPAEPQPKPRKKKVMYINDMEIELDDSDDEDRPSTPPPTPMPHFSQPPTTDLTSIVNLGQAQKTEEPPCPEPPRAADPPDPISSPPSLYAPIRFQSRANREREVTGGLRMAGFVGNPSSSPVRVSS